MRFNVTVEGFTRDFGRKTIVNERRGGSFGLCIHRPVLPDEGGLFESEILLSFSLILRCFCQIPTMSSIAKPLSSSPSTILLIPMRGTCVNTSPASDVPCLQAT